MKIIWRDGFNRDEIAERLVAENIKSKKEGEIMLAALRESARGDPSQWYVLVEDDKKLWRGMDELI